MSEVSPPSSLRSFFWKANDTSTEKEYPRKKGMKSTRRSSPLMPLHEMTSYSLLDWFSQQTLLYYLAFGIVQLCASTELIIALAQYHDNMAIVINRVVFRVLLPQCLWCVFVRAGQRTFCYHDDCPTMSCKVLSEQDEKARNRQLIIDLTLSFCFPVLAVLYLLRFVLIGGEFEELGDDRFLVLVGSLAVQTLLINILLALLYFESQQVVLKHSCADVVRRRWAVLKGTVVGMTAGISLTGAVRAMQDNPMMKSHSFWPVAIGSFVVATATCKSRVLRIVSAALSAVGLFNTDIITHILPHLQLIWFVGLVSLLFNVLLGATAIQWYPRTRWLVGGALTLSTSVVLVLEVSVFPLPKALFGLILFILWFVLLGRLAFHREFM